MDSKLEAVTPDPVADFLHGAARRTPAWVVSLWVHGVLLASLPLVVFAHRIFEPDRSCWIGGIRPARPQPVLVDDHDLARALVARESDVPGPLDLASPVPSALDALDLTHDPALEQERRSPVACLVAGTDAYDASPRIEDAPPGRFGGGRGGSIGAGGAPSCGVRVASGAEPRALVERLARRKAEAGGPADGAVEAGLHWLARHQSKDGSWSATDYDAHCTGRKCEGTGLDTADVGVTGLAVLAFLGAGYTPASRVALEDPVTHQPVFYGDVVRKGLQWILDHQDHTGAIGPTNDVALYNQSIAALALCEASALTNAIVFRRPAQRAVTYLVAGQNPGLGWRYRPRAGNNDTSVTGWAVMALESARRAGLEVPPSAFAGAKAWVERVTDANGITGYDKLGSGEIYVPGKNEAWQHHPTMTAVGVVCRLFADRKRGEPAIHKGAAALLADLPRWEVRAARPTVDFYYWYYGTLALQQLEGADGPTWKRWHNAVVGALCEHQLTRKDGCANGSWDTEGTDRWGYGGGRVYGTALCVLTLETSWRYASVFGSAPKGK